MEIKGWLYHKDAIYLAWQYSKGIVSAKKKEHDSSKGLTIFEKQKNKNKKIKLDILRTVPQAQEQDKFSRKDHKEIRLLPCPDSDLKGKEKSGNKNWKNGNQSNSLPAKELSYVIS